MAKRRIHPKELVNRGKFILLGFFLFYLITPVREILDSYLPDGNIVHVLIGVLGIIAVFWYFSFEK